MTNTHTRRFATGVVSLTTLAVIAASAPAATATSPDEHRDDRVVDALDRRAHPLGDRGWAALARMTHGADVVGVGEATHSSTEFMATKRELFEHLVEHRGFRTFAQEFSWSTGARLNDYVLHGVGDPQSIMNRELQNVYRFFNNEEMLDLIMWMREYNRTHDEKVRFIGTDIGFAGASVFDRVTAYVDDVRPDLSERIRELYAGLRPADDAEAFDYMRGYQDRPIDERAELAEQANKAHKLLTDVAADDDHGALALHDAWTIARTAKLYTYDMTDPEQAEQQNRLRDRTMADNVVWWREHTGDRILLSAQNGHVGYVSHDAEFVPKPQGAFLREELGRDYVNVGFTFDHGSFHAFDPETFFGPERPVSEQHSVPAAEPGTSEYVLDQVRFDDYVVDLRRVPGVARRWLDEEHPTRNVGLFWPEPGADVSLRETYDVLIHLDDVEASTLLP